DPVTDEGCYPMVPWAGRIGAGHVAWRGDTYVLPVAGDGNALHGLGKDTTWEHVGGGAFRVALGRPWPVEGEATVVYEPRDHGLRITLTWHSDTNDDDLGCSVGIHPWFRRSLTRGGTLQETLSPITMVERGTDGLPTGKLVPPGPQPWDDCFTLGSPPVLEWPGALRLTLTSGADWWVVYSGPRDALCVEPQTAPPDVFVHPDLHPRGPWPREIVLDLAAEMLE
ncbi:hypothetical protein, partial [Aeromicrobium sp.]|uniref:aldose epimerase family protein n=1 Tax=Aeromicrobium sp. TaxID=1871063 RepID=UPI00199E9F24